MDALFIHIDGVRIVKPFRMFWTTICLSAACILAAGSSSYAQDIPVPVNTEFDHILGAVIVSVPDYEGSDDQTFAGAPVGKWKYHKNQYVMLLGNKAYWNLSNFENFEFGMKGVFRLGRDDDIDDSVVKLMADVDDSIELGGFIGWAQKFNGDPRHRFSATLGITQDVSDGHDGYVIEVSAVYWRPVARALDLGFRGGFSTASDNYMSSFFGVSSADAAASGLSTFTAESGMKDFSLSLMAALHLSRKWHVGAGLNYKRLLNDASDSPVVDDRGSADQFIAGLAMFYTW